MRLIALGDNCIDLYRGTGEAFPGGNAVNVAVHAAQAGAQAEYLGSLGTDCMAELICRALDLYGVQRSGCHVIPGTTTKACCYRVTDGERQFLEVLTGPSWAGPLQLTEADLRRLSGADVVVSSCNAKLPEAIAGVAALLPVFTFDFGEKEKYRTEAYYDLVCASGMDLAMFSCGRMDQEAFAAFCAPLHRRGVRHVLATMGAAGQMLSNGTDILCHRPRILHALDTMGAGDAYLARLVTSLWHMGWRKGLRMSPACLQKAMEAASRTAADNCLRQGGIGVRVQLTKEEIQAWEDELHGHLQAEP